MLTSRVLTCCRHVADKFHVADKGGAMSLQQRVNDTHSPVSRWTGRLAAEHAACGPDLWQGKYVGTAVRT